MGVGRAAAALALRVHAEEEAHRRHHAVWELAQRQRGETQSTASRSSTASSASEGRSAPLPRLRSRRRRRAARRCRSARATSARFRKLPPLRPAPRMWCLASRSARPRGARSRLRRRGCSAPFASVVGRGERVCQRAQQGPKTVRRADVAGRRHSSGRPGLVQHRSVHRGARALGVMAAAAAAGTGVGATAAPAPAPVSVALLAQPPRDPTASPPRRAAACASRHLSAAPAPQLWRRRTPLGLSSRHRCPDAPRPCAAALRCAAAPAAAAPGAAAQHGRAALPCASPERAPAAAPAAAADAPPPQAAPKECGVCCDVMKGANLELTCQHCAFSACVRARDTDSAACLADARALLVLGQLLQARLPGHHQAAGVHEPRVPQDPERRQPAASVFGSLRDHGASPALLCAPRSLTTACRDRAWSARAARRWFAPTVVSSHIRYRGPPAC